MIGEISGETFVWFCLGVLIIFVLAILGLAIISEIDHDKH